jgi:hypothetical protein
VCLSSPFWYDSVLAVVGVSLAFCAAPSLFDALQDFTVRLVFVSYNINGAALGHGPCTVWEVDFTYDMSHHGTIIVQPVFNYRGCVEKWATWNALHVYALLTVLFAAIQQVWKRCSATFCCHLLCQTSCTDFQLTVVRDTVASVKLIRRILTVKHSLAEQERKATATQDNDDDDDTSLLAPLIPRRYSEVVYPKSHLDRLDIIAQSTSQQVHTWDGEPQTDVTLFGVTEVV